MADQDYPTLYEDMEESAQRTRAAAIAFEHVLGGPETDMVPVNGYPDQPTVAGRFKARMDTLQAPIDAAIEAAKRFLGSRTVAPTARADGSALQPGDTYWNPTSSLEFRWNGSAWFVPTADGQEIQQRLAASDGATRVGHGAGTVAQALDKLAAKDLEILSVRDKGAKGDGATNDAAAFTAAAAAGTTVWVTPGTYIAAGSFGTAAHNWMIVDGATLSDSCILLGKVRKVGTPTKNLFLNGAMQINQRGGEISEFGRYQIANRPFRFDTSSRPILKPDGSWEDLAFNRGVTLDRWLVYLNYLGQTNGTGFVEQVRCINADAWAASVAYGEGALVRAPAGQYGDGYVYRCIAPHTSAAWNTEVKTATDPSSWQSLPRYWALYGIYETDPKLQNKFALHWKQTTGSTSQVWLEQRILGVNWIKPGKYSLSFLAKNRSGGDVPVRASTIQEMGVGQADYTSSSAIQNITSTASIQKHSLVLTDPTVSKASGFTGNNRMECVQAQIYFPTAGQTFDLLITDIQLEEGERSSFEAIPYEQELDRCQAYFWKTNPTAFPARYASYVADAVAGTPQYNVKEVDQLWDRYGQIINLNAGQSINWGGTNRAFPNNEREIPGAGKIRATVERQAKAHPSLGTIDFPTAMIRDPSVTIYDLIGGTAGYAINNGRFQAPLRFDYQGAGSSARPFAQRSLTKIALFYATRNRADFQAQNIEPAITTSMQDFSVPAVIPGGQDAIGTGFLTLFGGYKYDWSWVLSSQGSGVYYLCLSNTQYYKNGGGALINLNAWAASTPYTVGDVVRVTGSLRFYECMVAHTSDIAAPNDTDVRWRPYGRITYPTKLLLDGSVEVTRTDIADPAAMPNVSWYFGDKDLLGFSTLYVKLGGTLPGSVGRVRAQSYDQYLALYENLLCQAVFDAEILSVS